MLLKSHVAYRARTGEVPYKFDTAREAEAFRTEHRGRFIVRRLCFTMGRASYGIVKMVLSVGLRF